MTSMQTSFSFEIAVLPSRALAFPIDRAHFCHFFCAAPYVCVVPPPYDSLWRTLQRGDCYHVRAIRVSQYRLLDEGYAHGDGLSHGFHFAGGSVLHASDAKHLVGKMRIQSVLGRLKRGLHFDARESRLDDVHAGELHHEMRIRCVFRSPQQNPHEVCSHRVFQPLDSQPCEVHSFRGARALDGGPRPRVQR
jgi:hypothetical protein